MTFTRHYPFWPPGQPKTLELPREGFAIASLIVFAIAAVLMLQRGLRSTLQERTLPIGWLALLALLTIVPSSAYAQASITGVVRDTSGAVLPGVTVTVTQTDTGFTRTVVTDEAGAWSMPNLPLGPYKLEAMLQGFSTYVQTGIVLQVGATPTLNVQLALGDLAETVTVEGAAPLVDVKSAGISEVVEQERIVELPHHRIGFALERKKRGQIGAYPEGCTVVGQRSLGFAQRQLGVAASDVVVHRDAKIRDHDAQNAARPESPTAFTEETRCFPAVEMLDHVRGVDRVDRPIGMRDARHGVGMANAVAPAIGREFQVAAVDRAECRQQPRRQRPRGQTHGRRVVVVQPARRRRHSAADVETHGHALGPGLGHGLRNPSSR